MGDNIDYGEKLRELSRSTGLNFPSLPSQADAKRILRNCQPPPERYYGPLPTSEEILEAGRRFSEATASALVKAIKSIPQ